MYLLNHWKLTLMMIILENNTLYITYSVFSILKHKFFFANNNIKKIHVHSHTHFDLFIAYYDENGVAS